MSLNATRKYLDRLKERRNDPFYRLQADWLIKKNVPEYSRISNKYEDYLNRSDAPESMKAQAVQSQGETWSNIVSSSVGQANIQEKQRRKNLEGKIDETEFEADLLEEEKKKQDKMNKANMWKGILRTGASALGAVLAIPTGGLGIAAGAAIGGMIGTVGGEVMAHDIQDEDYMFDVGAVTQATSDLLIEGITSSNLAEDTEALTALQGLMNMPEYKALPVEQQKRYAARLRMYEGNAKMLKQEIENMILDLNSAI